MAQEKEKEEGQEEQKEAPAKPNSKKKLIIIGAAVLVLAVGGGAAAMVLGGKSAAKNVKKPGVEERPVEEEVKHYRTAELDTFVVNLSEAASFLKITIIVEYDPAILARGESGGDSGGGGHGGGGSGGEGEASGGKLPEAMKSREPMIKDAIIRVLSSKKPADVLSMDGKEQLKEELMEAINEALGLEEGPVVAIYFKEFLIQ